MEKEIEKRSGAIITQPRENGIAVRYGTFNKIQNKSTWIELRASVSLLKQTTNSIYQDKIRKRILILIKNYKYFNEKILTIVDFSSLELEKKNKCYYEFNLYLQPKDNILWIDPEFHLEITNLIDQIKDYIQTEGTFLFLKSKMR